MAAKFQHMKRFSALLCLSTALLQIGCVAEKNKNSNSGDSTAQIASEKMTDSGKKSSVATHNSSDSTPKNIIIFIGDGMGISTITAGRIFVGQEKGQMGEEHALSFDKFPQLALIKTYNTNAQVPDSAGTATAILSGYKTNIGAVNVRPDTKLDNMFLEGCGGVTTATLTVKAKAAEKSVGIISTARLTHATPAAMFAHSVSRDIEADKDLQKPFDYEGCKSIAQQLIESDVDLALGGGRKEFTDEQVAAWPGTVVSTQAELMSAPDDARVLGLFNRSHMTYHADRAGTQEPSLAEMTTYTMDRLSKDKDGYVMMVEAGRIDHAHHGTNAYRALKDLQALDNAVAAAVAKADEDTLIIVTADHSHVFTMAGYPARGNPILGLSRSVDRETGGPAAEYSLDEDGKPYTTLGYQNGPNIRETDSDVLTDNMVQDPDYMQQTAVHLGSETHAGEDVALYATGPGAARFNGVMEQDEIGKILGEFLGH